MTTGSHLPSSSCALPREPSDVQVPSQAPDTNAKALWLSKPGSRGHVPGSEARTEGEKRRKGRTRAAFHLVGEGLLGFCKAHEPANHYIWRGHLRHLLCLPEYK